MKYEFRQNLMLNQILIVMDPEKHHSYIHTQTHMKECFLALSNIINPIWNLGSSDKYHMSIEVFLPQKCHLENTGSTIFKPPHRAPGGGGGCPGFQLGCGGGGGGVARLGGGKGAIFHI